MTTCIILQMRTSILYYIYLYHILTCVIEVVSLTWSFLIIEALVVSIYYYLNNNNRIIHSTG